MKKINLTILLITLITVNLFSQGFGLKGGISTINFSGPDVEDTDSRTGIYIGAFINKGDGGVRWTPEIIYQQKGAKNDVLGEDLKSHLNYIDFAINGHFHINDEFALTGGPYLGYLLSGKYDMIVMDNVGNLDVDTESIDDWDEINRMEFGGGFGAIYHLNDLFQMNINYKIGFTSVSKDDDSEFYNTSFNFGVGYIFSY